MKARTDGSPPSPARMDAISLLVADHRRVKDLIHEFRKLCRTRHGSKEEKMILLQKLGHELCIHAAIEEQIFYPALRHAVRERASVLKSLEEHHVMKTLLAELHALSPADERCEAKARVLIDIIERHIEEEEGVQFTQARTALGPGELMEIGAALRQARGLVSSSARPSAPDTPPQNLTSETRPLLERVLHMLSSSA